MVSHQREVPVFKPSEHMDSEFDPYHKWLGIPASKRPITHYLLLSIALDEADREVIRSAAIRQRSHVERFVVGKQAPAARQLMREIDEAEITLLDPEMREQYDRRMSLTRQRRGLHDPAPRRRRGGKTVGEETGFFAEYAGIMAVLCVCFFGMAAASFYLPWKKLADPDPDIVQQIDRAPPGVVAIEARLPEVMPPPPQVQDVALAAPETQPPLPPAPPAWKSLFDGSPLSGWNDPEGVLKVEEGVLVSGHRRGVAIAPGEYAAFTAELEFRLGARGNSGVGIFYSGEGDPAANGLEVQLLDDAAYPKLTPDQVCGSLFRIAEVTTQTFRRWPEWNSLSIRASGDDIEVTLNGTRVLEESREALQQKFPEHVGLKRSSGTLCLFPISGRGEYRNMRIREEPSSN